MTRAIPIAAAALAVAVALTLGGDVPLEAQEPVPVKAVTQEKFKTAVSGWRSSRRTIYRLRRALRKERRFTSLVRHPSPENNRALARLLFPEGFWALDKIANGESSWHETVWNGGATGAFPDRTRAQGSGACLVGNAYGIGQACPRQKMADWAGTEAVYRVNSLQIHWMNHYATGRFGSLSAAGNHWTASGSW